MFDTKTIELINEKQKQLTKELEKDNEEAEFLEKFISNTNFCGIKNIQKIDLADLFVATFLTYSKDSSFQEVKKATYDNRVLFKNLSSRSFEPLFSYITDIASLDDYRTKLETNLSKDGIDPFVRDLCTGYNQISQLISLLNYNEKQNNTNILPLIDLCHEHPDEFFDTASIIFSIIEFKEEIIVYQESFEKIKPKLQKRFSQKESKRIINDKILSDYNMGPYEECINQIFTHCKETVSREKNKKRELRKELKNILTLQEWIDEKSDKQSYLHICPELLKIKDEKIRLQVLKDIYKTNYEICMEANEKYDNLLKNSINHYKKVLKKYNIYVSDDSIDFKMSVDEVKVFLEQAKKLNLIDNIDIIKILKITTADISNTIISYINKGYINTEFINSHQEIFDGNLNTSAYVNLEKNINYLNSQNISSSIIMKIRDNLLKENELIAKGITSLQEYQLFASLKNADSYQFLIDENLEDKIDVLIELGYEKNIQEDLELLNYTIDDYKRLTILNRLNIKITSTEELKRILNNKKFVVGSNKIDDYLFDIKQYVCIESDETMTKQNFLDLLEEKNKLLTSTNSYIFDSVIISKNKVKKQVENIPNEELSFNDCFKCLTKNKILNEAEYETILNVLNFGKTNQNQENQVKLIKKS